MFLIDYLKSWYYTLKQPKDPMKNFYGMIGYSGYYGEGKTLGMVDQMLKLEDLCKKYDYDLRIYTNFNYYNQTGALISFDDIVDICDKKRADKNGDNYYVLFAIDELQNCLNSRQWNETKKMESLLPIFTMTRKLKVMFLYTTPVFSMSDKNIRISSRLLFQCNKHNDFMFFRRKINPIDLEQSSNGLKLSIFPSSYCLLTDRLKNAYNSYAFIETMKKQDYLKHEELQDSFINNSITVLNSNKKSK